jgi:hypothetical protein
LKNFFGAQFIQVVIIYSVKYVLLISFGDVRFLEDKLLQVSLMYSFIGKIAFFYGQNSKNERF